MPARYVYVVTRTDYNHYSDYKGRTKKLGAFATVKEANKLAKSHAKELAENADASTLDREVHYGSHNEIEIQWRTCESYPERDRFKVEVSAEYLGDAPDPNKTEYGQMVSIPRGKLGGLKGARFLFTGTFKYLAREAAHAAVCAYGGEFITYPGETAGTSRPFSNHNKLDFVVTGTGVKPHKMRTADVFGDRKLDEREFFKLLDHGLPTDGTTLDSLFTDDIGSETQDDDSSDEEDEWKEAPPDSLDEIEDDEDDTDESESDHDERSAKRQRH